MYLLESLRFGSIEEMNLEIFSTLEFVELIKSLRLLFVTILNSLEGVSPLTQKDPRWYQTEQCP